MEYRIKQVLVLDFYLDFGLSVWATSVHVYYRLSCCFMDVYLSLWNLNTFCLVVVCRCPSHWNLHTCGRVDVWHHLASDWPFEFHVPFSWVGTVHASEDTTIFYLAFPSCSNYECCRVQFIDLSAIMCRLLIVTSSYLIVWQQSLVLPSFASTAW